MRQEKGPRKDSSEQTQMPIRAGKGDLGNEEMSENMMQVNNFTRLIELEDVDSFVSYYNQVLKNEFLGEAQMQNQFSSLDQQMKKIVLLKLKQIVAVLKDLKYLSTENKAYCCFPLYQEFLTKLNQQKQRTQPMQEEEVNENKICSWCSKICRIFFCSIVLSSQFNQYHSTIISTILIFFQYQLFIDLWTIDQWTIARYGMVGFAFYQIFQASIILLLFIIKRCRQEKKKNQNKQQQKSGLSESHLEDQDPERRALKDDID